MYLATVLRPLADDYELHQYLWCYFPQCNRASKRPFLYRVFDKTLSMLSSERPSCPAVQIDDQIETGRTYQFNVLASPLKGSYRDKETGQRRKRGAWETKDEQMAWLQRRIVGATIPFCKVEQKPKRVFSVNGHRAVQPEAEFKGALFVHDRAAFLRSIAQGIGGRGAWGHGLLILPEVMDAGA